MKKLIPSEGSVREAQRTQEQLETARSTGGASIVFDRGSGSAEVRVPKEIADLVREAITELARGHTVRLVRDDEELTTQQAADLLNVSPPFVTKLLNRGQIPHHRVRTHRRV